MSDKRQLRKCGNGKSYLVETETFQPNLRDGTQKEPKFELDSLEIKVQSIIRRTPDVLLVLSHQAGDKTIKVVISNCTVQKGKTWKTGENLTTERKENKH